MRKSVFRAGKYSEDSKFIMSSQTNQHFSLLSKSLSAVDVLRNSKLMIRLSECADKSGSVLFM